MSSSAGKYLRRAYNHIGISTSLNSQNSDNQSKVVSQDGTSSKQRNQELAEFYSLFTSYRRRRILRIELNKHIIKNNYSGINKDIIEIVVKDFIELLEPKSETQHTNNCSVVFPMSSLFYCKCGGLFYNRDPTTLPCGHTQCKVCADQFKVCRFCGFQISMKIQVNRFLVELISRWCKEHYRVAMKKEEATKLIEEGKLDKALEALDEVISSSADTDFHAYNMRAELYTKLGLHKKALCDAQSSCSINYNCGQSHFRRGLCLSNMGLLNEAIDAFQVCLEVEPLDLALSNAVISSIDKIISLPNVDDGENSQGPSTLSCSSSSGSDSDDSENDRASHPDKETQKRSCPESNNDVCAFSDTVKKKKKKMLSSETIDKEPQEEKHEDLGNNSSKPSVKLKHGIPENLISEEDVECKLCYDILLRPVTTTCGHVFCKNCLLRTLDHNAVCPVCRVSLHDYLKDPSKPSTYLIEELLKLFFETQFNDRQEVYNSRMRELSRVGIDENVEVPVFVVTIAFPYVNTPLHVFEPRYRLMIRECIESGSKRFGMCSKVNENQIADVGAICEITKFKYLPDGRFIVQTVATQRFHVKEKRNLDSICYAKVEFFKDEPEDLSQQQFKVSSRRIYNQLCCYVNSLTTAEQDTIFRGIGMLPRYEENPSKFEHGVPWVWWGLAAIPINFSAKLVLLRSKCVSERMWSLERFLRFIMQRNPGNITTNSHRVSS